MPTPVNQLSATIEVEVIRKPEPFATKSANVTRTTHKKLTKQLRNSLWLRICSGRIAFMLCWQLQNSTKFHFGNTKTNKSIRSTTENEHQQQHQKHQHQHRYAKIIGKNRKQRRRRCRRSGAVQTIGFLKVKNTDIANDTATDRDKRGIDIGAATEDAKLLAKWIHSSSSASSGTVIRLTWQ